MELYYIVTGGNENDLISKLVDRYGELSSHLTVEKIDPDLHPNLLPSIRTRNWRITA